jgi:hypothetical protein
MNTEKHINIQLFFRDINNSELKHITNFISNIKTNINKIHVNYELSINDNQLYEENIYKIDFCIEKIGKIKENIHINRFFMDINCLANKDILSILISFLSQLKPFIVSISLKLEYIHLYNTSIISSQNLTFNNLDSINKMFETYTDDYINKIILS